MTLWISDAKFNSVALIIIAIISLIGTIVTAVIARQAKNNAQEANVNAQEAKKSAQVAAHEVRTNGGMSDPNPNMNDHVKYQTELLEMFRDHVIPVIPVIHDVDRRLTQHIKEETTKLEEVSHDLKEHLEHSRIMDAALAEVYLAVKPDGVSILDED